MPIAQHLSSQGITWVTPTIASIRQAIVNAKVFLYAVTGSDHPRTPDWSKSLRVVESGLGPKINSYGSSINYLSFEH